jgi:hypothetical protein
MWLLLLLEVLVMLVRFWLLLLWLKGGQLLLLCLMAFMLLCRAVGH